MSSAKLSQRRQRWRIFVNFAFSRLGLLLSLGGMLFIVALLASLIGTGYRSFYQSFISVNFSVLTLEVIADEQVSAERKYLQISTNIENSLIKDLRIDEVSQATRKQIGELVSGHAVFYSLEKITEDPVAYVEKRLWIPASDAVDQFLKRRQAQEATGDLLTQEQVEYVESLSNHRVLQQKFSTIFLTRADSRTPEMAGIYGAVMGSLFTLLITFVLAIPIGIASAVYLQEFASQNRLVRLIEINISNLAAVPSIIFGLLGLAVFINLLDMPRSVPLVGGIVLALMTFPTIVIASRQALMAVPHNIREAALAVGATRHQMVFHHVVPFAMPSMMTGSIIGMAQALGETAPLLMLGMVAFIASAPSGILDPATTLPVQIFLWSDSPERGILEKTVGAILVLIVFLILMNALAVYLRFRFEKSRRS